jgi:bifunctional non-homologous end joining protein LigD
VEAARKIRQTRFVLDGEAVILGVDGIADFDALHSRQHDEEVQLCAFDISWRAATIPLHLRKTSLQRLLARRPEGIFVKIGPDLFLAACDGP